MKKLLGIVVVVLTFFVIQPTKVESYQDMYKDLLKIGQDIAEKNAQKKLKKAQKKFELAKWDLKKKDLVALKFEEIKSLFSGNVFFGEYNDNEIKGRFKEIYYEDGKYRGYVFGQEQKILFEKGDAFLILPGGSGTIEEATEVISWKILGIHKKPIIIFNFENYWNSMIEMYNNAKKNKFGDKNLQSVCITVKTFEEFSLLFK